MGVALYTYQILEAHSFEECEDIIFHIDHQISTALEHYNEREKEWNPSKFEENIICRDGNNVQGLCFTAYWSTCKSKDLAFSKEANAVDGCGRWYCTGNFNAY